MRLLIITQIVDRTDPALGFFHRWIEEFAVHAEEVHVICLKEGEHSLPAHVFVHSLGKEKHPSRMAYLAKFYSFIWKYRHSYDQVFVHMNPEYVVLGGLFWRSMRKRIGLWYTHRTVDIKLRLASLFMHQGFTGSVESFRLKSPKILVTGQGVDTSVFVPSKNISTRPLTLVVVGRISPIKNLELAVDTLRELRKTRKDARLSIVGAPAKEEDFLYQETLRTYIVEQGLTDAVDMLGGKDAQGVLEALQSSDVFLHTSQTNSADKTIVEAMAVGVYVLTSSPVYAKDLPFSCVQPIDPVAYAQEINRFLELSAEERDTITQFLREVAIERHSLARLIKLIVSTLSVK